MVRLLPFILIPVLIIAGLGYWRFGISRQKTAESAPTETAIEVPKTLPAIPSTPTPVPTTIRAPGTPDPRVAVLESAVTELKARISTLENATPAPVVSLGKSTVYIPLGAGGSWSDVDWHSLTEYEVSLNPDNYPGYTGMSLEANFRLAESAGTGSVRLYNITDGSTVSGEISSTSTAFSLKSSSSFKLPSGTKTYRLQVKSTERKELFIQSARIKVNF